MKTNCILLFGCAALVGCSTPKRKHLVDTRLAEESRALTTGVVDALDLQPPDARDAYTATARAFAKQNQRIQGLPSKPFATPILVGSESNLPPAEAAAKLSTAKKEVEERFAFQEQLRDKALRLDQKLIESGLIREQQREARWHFWLKWLGGGSLLLGSVVALCVSCPVAIPIVGRLLGWLVSKIPALAGAAGVVSVRAFDAIVRGIEQTKSGSGNTTLANESLATTPFDLSALHLNLSRAMDESHKALVRKRKVA